ncbi:hypothetical protein IPV08_24195 [Methylobacterium sp. SD274]|nr:hypothetical protein [Methylobacterium sp. SD274]MBO1023058.1 hypothetical protein [Methylobacterium sp. SD274]
MRHRRLILYSTPWLPPLTVGSGFSFRRVQSEIVSRWKPAISASAVIE